MGAESLAGFGGFLVENSNLRLALFTYQIVIAALARDLLKCAGQRLSRDSFFVEQLPWESWESFKKNTKILGFFICIPKNLGYTI